MLKQEDIQKIVKDIYEPLLTKASSGILKEEALNDLFVKSLTERLKKEEDVASLQKWDAQTSKKYESLNAYISFIPTLIGVGLIIFVFTNFGKQRQIIDKYQQQLSDKDSVIRYNSQWLGTTSIAVDSFLKEHRRYPIVPDTTIRNFTNFYYRSLISLDSIYFKYDSSHVPSATIQLFKANN